MADARTAGAGTGGDRDGDRGQHNGWARGEHNGWDGNRPPGIERRDARQDQRIQNGVRDGSLTRGEANRLDRGQNRIDRYEARARSDGTVTPGERNRIDNMQNRESRQIYNDRHNDRTATGTDADDRHADRPRLRTTGAMAAGSSAQAATRPRRRPARSRTGGRAAMAAGSSAAGRQHDPDDARTGTQPDRRLAQLVQRLRRLPHAAGGGHAAAAGAGAASDHDRAVQPRTVSRWPQLRRTPLELDMTEKRRSGSRVAVLFAVSSPGAACRPSRACAARASGSCPSDCAAAPR